MDYNDVASVTSARFISAGTVYVVGRDGQTKSQTWCKTVNPSSLLQSGDVPAFSNFLTTRK